MEFEEKIYVVDLATWGYPFLFALEQFLIYYILPSYRPINCNNTRTLKAKPQANDQLIVSYD